MTYQATFKRYEIKYLLTQRQKEAVLIAISPYMKLDKYGLVTIRNIYMDTDNFRLIRRSLEKPPYKEKLRIRSYRQAMPETEVFVELKKKYKSVVYKRRLSMPWEIAENSLAKDRPLPIASQIGKEIEYFRNFYGSLRPRMFLSYEREAYFAADGSDLRVTFDKNILYRESDLSLCGGIYGDAVIDEDQCLMEIKTSGGMPMWLSHILSSQGLFKTCFSKYGNAYRDMMKRHGSYRCCDHTEGRNCYVG